MQRSRKIGRKDSLDLSLEFLDSSNEDVRSIAIEFISPGPFQPRFEFDDQALQELADSIREHGIIQPIVVRTKGNDRYEIIAGERRWRAAQRIPLHNVPIIVRNVTDKAALAISLIENIQRESLNPVEEASQLKRLIDEFSLAHSELAQTIGKSRAAVSNKLRLLNLTEPVLEMLKVGKMEVGHAKALLGLTGEDQMRAAKRVVNLSLSVRATERLVKSWKEAKETTNKPPVSDNVNMRELETQLSDHIGARVSIRDQNNKGHIRIDYRNLDELDGIVDRIVDAVY